MTAGPSGPRGGALDCMQVTLCHYPQHPARDPAQNEYRKQKRPLSSETSVSRVRKEGSQHESGSISQRWPRPVQVSVNIARGLRELEKETPTPSRTEAARPEVEPVTETVQQ